MNRSALKTYAPKARLDFIRAMTDRAAFFGLTPARTEPMEETGDVVIIGGRAFPKVVAQQRRSLEARVQRQGFDQVMEAMAYTWFNRFVALRYMELHGYLDHGYRVLSHPEGKATPEIVEHAEHVTLPGLDAQQVINLKLDGTKEAELYRLLLVAQCNALHEAMPFLFEKVADETELLLPDNLLHSDSVIRKLVNDIEEADWQQVEIIGWLYQFYISDKKDEVIGKVVKSEDIPAATQLFTPNWIVKYLVQNTLGRQWLATYPESPLRQQMEYYIEPAEQANEVKAQLAAITPKSLDPETLTLLDDACGSGHILVEAYDLFKAIYQERGYRSKDIPRLILQKNLFGLEIDDRAAQLAAFALLMKARADDRRIFADHVQPNVIAIQESKGLENLLRPAPAAAKGVGELPFADSDLFPQSEKQLTLTKPNQESPLAAVEPCLHELIRLFEHGKTFGSLIRVPPDLAAQLPAARQSIEGMAAQGQLWEHRAAALLLPLLKQAQLLARTYDAVVTNPPYMGNKGFNTSLKDYSKREYPRSRFDLCIMFIERSLAFTRAAASTGLVTMHNWMFNQSFEDFRQALLSSTTIRTMAHLGAKAFDTISGEIVQTTAFVCINQSVASFTPTFIRLVEGDDEDCKRDMLAKKQPVYTHAKQDDFRKIPGSPLAYWISSRIRDLFSSHPPLSSVAETKEGLATADNDQFLRCWHEVAIDCIGFRCLDRDEAKSSGHRWFPHNKGGPYRRWYGNMQYVVNWWNDGDDIKRKKAQDLAAGLITANNSKCWNQGFYFKEGLSWSAVSSGDISLRANGVGFVFDTKGRSLFTKDSQNIHVVLGFLNSAVASVLLKVISQSLDFTAGIVAKLPWVRRLEESERIRQLTQRCIALSRDDWDSFEASWDFAEIPLFNSRSEGRTVSEAFDDWATKCRGRVSELKTLESEIHGLVIDAYGLRAELSAEATEGSISLARPDRETDMQRLVSYAIGCMMGRYSLDKPGLIYASSRNEGFDPSQYRSFPADADGIIPVTELAWFHDDATERFVELIAKAWPREHLEENLKFIADSLGPNRDEHPRDTIRRYLATGFYKDHLQTYKKRPIYWLFSSGRQRAFQCLVYLHRYHEGTLARMRTEYVIPLQGKMSQRIEQLAGDTTAATSTSHRRKLEKERETLVKQHTELVAFDEKLRHSADQRIALDLDDGVKVNYGKFGDLLAEVKAVTGGTEE